MEADGERVKGLSYFSANRVDVANTNIEWAAGRGLGWFELNPKNSKVMALFCRERPARKPADRCAQCTCIDWFF